METLIASCFKAVRSLFAPGMFSVAIYSVLLTIAVLLLFVFGMSGLTGWISHSFGYAMLASVGGFMLAWFLFPGIMPVIVNFFDVRIVTLIERQDYPQATPLTQPEFWPELAHDARFSLFTIVLNIVVLPLYLIPVVGAICFYLLNGYLLGKEFFIMAARRHIALEEAKALWKKHARLITIGGMGFALMATIPLINLFAPFWGIALMAHLFHALRGTKAEVLLP